MQLCECCILTEFLGFLSREWLPRDRQHLLCPLKTKDATSLTNRKAVEGVASIALWKLKNLKNVWTSYRQVKNYRKMHSFWQYFLFFFFSHGPLGWASNSLLGLQQLPWSYYMKTLLRTEIIKANQQGQKVDQQLPGAGKRDWLQTGPRDPFRVGNYPKLDCGDDRTTL